MSSSLRPTGLPEKRILLVEDEHLIAADMAEALLGAGASLIGPVGSLSAALRLAQSVGPIDAAVLDVQLHDGIAYPLIDRLRDRGVPILLYTGWARDALDAPYRGLPICRKPTPLPVVISLLHSLCRPAGSPVGAICPGLDGGSATPS